MSRAYIVEGIFSTLIYRWQYSFSKSYVKGQLLGLGSIHYASMKAVSKVNFSLSMGTSATG